MYLEHFGLKEQPFKITPVTDFFFPGANRAEILEALLYSITESEGIIKVTGEVGSGKTMLCRMLLEKFPENIEAVYLANPSLSREEMLYAIADGLNLKLDGQRVNIILQSLQNHLELKLSEGKRVVILVDEAHAMPLETMEELRLLYNLQIGSQKLLHIMLFGQPELNAKLSQPNMRQLKDRIIHHFSMLPLSQNIIESYLLFRMRTAGYRGPTPFTPPAAALIGKASQGLMRRVNIIADKALLAAFVENTHSVDTRHVQAAIRDTESTTGNSLLSRFKPNFWTVSGVAFGALLIAGLGWILGSLYATKPSTSESHLSATANSIQPAQLTTTPATSTLTIRPAQTSEPPPSPAPQPGAPEANKIKTTDNTPPPPAKELLFNARLGATQHLLSKLTTGSASIQLFYTNNIRTDRIEKFLEQAEHLGILHEIYILPINIGGKKGLRILYGIYPGSDAARSAIKTLPRKFLDSFAPAIFLLEDAPVP